MSVMIQKAILHALDPASGVPVLSAEPMFIDEGVREFLETHFEKTLESDEVQTGILRDDHGFGQRMRDLGMAAAGAAAGTVGMSGGWGGDGADRGWDTDGADGGWGGDGGAGGGDGVAGGGVGAGLDPLTAKFVEESRMLAEQIYQIVSGNEAVPSGDLICVMAEAGGSRYFAALKMNYNDGYSHYYINGNLTIVEQRVLLPGTGRKLEEAFIVNLDSLEVRIIEKKYLMMDESREAYLSSRILGCLPEISERSKLMAVKKAMQKANKEVLGDKKVVEQEFMSRMHGYLAENEEPVISEMCKEVLRDYPQIAPMVEEHLVNENIDPESTVQVGQQTVKRFEKQSVKTPDGIEVKIPADLFADQRAMEFIQQPDGSISLLIKNILL